MNTNEIYIYSLDSKQVTNIPISGVVERFHENINWVFMNSYTMLMGCCSRVIGNGIHKTY